MRATTARRTALAASAAALTLLATACGGSSDADGKDDKGAAAGSSSAPKTPAKTLTADELGKAALAQGDVKGTKITAAGPADEVPAAGVKADKEECLPVAHAMYGVAQEGSAASVRRKVIDEPKGDGKKKSLEELAEGGAEDALKDAFDLTSTFVALHSYEGAAGAEAFTALKKAAAECAGGFTATVAGTPTKVVSVAEEKITGGDESAAWTVTSQDDGEKAPFKLVALRKGNTVATFFAFNLAATGGGVTFEVPAEVVAAQDEKLA
ncbi:sensor domain-containing protein [Streptomyces sp. NPDC017448]|uniref:sensor domain-containing protein n=1 Tax=Streptomyces sp. NPDC017448 TaxID=3364996 RepID=UPI00378DFD8B